MNSFDVVIVVLAIGASVGGWRVGFVQRSFGWLGLGVAAAIAIVVIGQIGPSENPTNVDTFLVLGGFFTALFLGNMAGNLVGSRASKAVHRSSLGQFDHVAGAALGLVGALLLAWILPAQLADIPGRPAELVRGSAIAGELVDIAGPPPDVFGELSSALGVGDYPSVFSGLEPTPEAEPPPQNSPLNRDVARRAAAATVRIRSRGCAELQSGTGWVIERNTVVTNAHVIAGAGPEDVAVETSDGTKFAGQVIAYDPGTDLAVLHVEGLSVSPLTVSSAERGERGSVFGYPGGGGLREDPFVVSRLVNAKGHDIYDRETVERDVLVIGSGIQPGDSGGPLVATDGTVVGIAFAVAPDRPDAAYAIDTSELPHVLAAASGRTTVSAGTCLAD